MKKKIKKANTGSNLPAVVDRTPAKINQVATVAKDAGPKITRTIPIGGKFAAAKALGKTVLRRVPYVGAIYTAGDLAYSAYNAYKENQKANASKGTGDIMSTMEKNKGKSFGPSTSSAKGPVKPGARSAASVTQQKSADAYYTKLAGGAKKPTGSGAPKRKPTRTASATIAAPKREMPSMSLPKPSAPGIQSKPKVEGREYTPAEIKAMTALKKGTKKDGTVKAGAAGKAKTIMRRADAINKRAASKEARVNKRASVKAAKANVKAVKRSYKK